MTTPFFWHIFGRARGQPLTPTPPCAFYATFVPLAKIVTIQNLAQKLKTSSYEQITRNGGGKGTNAAKYSPHGLHAHPHDVARSSWGPGIPAHMVWGWRGVGGGARQWAGEGLGYNAGNCTALARRTIPERCNDKRVKQVRTSSMAVCILMCVYMCICIAIRLSLAKRLYLSSCLLYVC